MTYSLFLIWFMILLYLVGKEHFFQPFLLFELLCGEYDGQEPERSELLRKVQDLIAVLKATNPRDLTEEDKQTMLALLEDIFVLLPEEIPEDIIRRLLGEK